MKTRKIVLLIGYCPPSILKSSLFQLQSSRENSIRPFGINSLLAVKHNIMLSQSRQMWTYSTTAVKAVESFFFFTSTGRCCPEKQTAQYPTRTQFSSGFSKSPWPMTPWRCFPSLSKASLLRSKFMGHCVQHTPLCWF